MSIIDAISFALEMGKFAWDVFGRVKDDCRDTMFTQYLVNKLRDEVQKLRDRREPVLERFNASFINADDIEPSIMTWLNDANAAVQKAEKILHDYERLLSDQADSPGCTCTPNIKQRRLIGSRAYMHKESVITLCSLDEMESDEQSVSSWLKTKSPNEYISFSSREEMLKEIMECVRSSDGELFIGVCGAGGMGKTTLAREVYRLAVGNLFSNDVAMATVTHKADVWRIQEELATCLGLRLNNENTIKQRADALCLRLWKTDGFIILDDLWGAIDLKEIGIPSENGIKLLFTSRSEKVLAEMGSGKRVYHLRALTDVDARTLFETAVGKEAVLLDPERKAIGMKLVDKCDGIPISIKALAAMLLSTSDHTPTWQDALENLSQSDDAYYSTMEFNYQHLIGDGVKSLFLTYPLFGVVHHIPTREVIAYSMGLGLFEGIKRVKRVRFRLQTLVGRLQASSLIINSSSSSSNVDDDRDIAIKMHDTVHDIAIKIAAKEGHHAIFVAKSGLELEEYPIEKLRECTAISLPHVHINSRLPPRLMMVNEFPKLKIFILIAKGKSHGQLPPMLFQGMKELKVLHLSQLSFTSVPSSIGALYNLTTLLLDFCDGINEEDMTIIGGLTRLQVFSLRGSSIKYLPKEIGHLSELRLLDLSHCRVLQKIEPGVFKSLLHLEELYMERSFTNWEADGVVINPSNAKIEELTMLPDLTVLHIHVPDISMLPEDPAMITKLDKFQILIGKSCDWLKNKQVSRTLKLNGDSRGILLQELVQATLDRTEELHLDGLKGSLNKSLHQLSVGGFHEVKRLHVQNSPLINYAVQSVQRSPPVPSFEKLELLCLQNMENLEQVCHGPPPKIPESFTRLKFLHIKQCWKLKNLFCASLVIRGLPELEEIAISHCPVIKGIVQVEVDDATYGEDNKKKIKPCNLRRLELENLPKFTAFCTTSDDQTSPTTTSSLPNISNNGPDATVPCVLFDYQQVSFPQLESLALSGIGKLKEIWPRQYVEFGDLRSLEVWDCGSLSLCIPSGVLPSLKKLESLNVEGCSSMQQLFDCGDGGHYEEILPQLKQLRMVNLPNLTSIFTHNAKAASQLTIFRKLKHMKVERCDSLTNLFSLATAQHLHELQILRVLICKKMEAVVLDDAEFPKERISEANKTTTLSLPMLEFLSLETLPVLATFVQYSRVSTEPTVCFFSPKVSLPRLEGLVMESMESIKSIWLDELRSEGSFSRLRMLKISECESLSSSLIPPILMKKLQNLEEVVVHKCAALQVLFDCGSLHNHNCEGLMLPKLFRLDLRNLKMLEFIVQGYHPDVHLGLPSLKKVKLQECYCLTFLFRSGTARTLIKIESISIVDCNSMNQVVSIEDDCGEEQVVAPISFPHMRSLELSVLESLICFSSGGCLFEFPSLEDLQVHRCSSLKTFVRMPAPDDGALNTAIHSLFDDKAEFPKLNNISLTEVGVQKVWNDNEQLPLDSFFKLKSLEIRRCQDLETIAPAYMLRRLENLEKLEITMCAQLKQIFQTEGLTKLRNSNSQQQGLPSLKQVSLSECNSVSYVFPDAIARTLSKLESICIDECESMQQVVSKEDGGEEQVVASISFPNLRVLKLHTLGRLKHFGSSNTFIQRPALDDDGQLNSTTQMRSVNSSSSSRYSLFDDKVEFPNLENMYLYAVNMRTVWNDELHYPLDSFSKVKCLEIENCPNLVIIAPSNIVTRLQNLERVEIKHCIALHEFFEMEGQLNQEDAKGRGIDFEKLKHANYSVCPALESRMPKAVLRKFWEEDEEEEEDYSMY